MAKNDALHAVDVPVALALVDVPEATFQQLSAMLGISTSTAHSSVARLRLAGLVREEKRVVVRQALLEFLEHGVRYAFPARIERSMKGVATAHAGPGLASLIASDDAFVWPYARGSVSGQAIAPLLESAAELPDRSPGVYHMLTLVDALRVGRIRERAAAAKMLRDRLYETASAA